MHLQTQLPLRFILSAQSNIFYIFQDSLQEIASIDPAQFFIYFIVYACCTQLGF